MITLRHASIEDAVVISDLIEKLFVEVSHDLKKVEIRELFEALSLDGKHTIIIAMNERSECVGIATVSESCAIYARGVLGIINELYVLPDYRSQRVGKMLLDATKRLAKEKAWKRLELTTPGRDWQRTQQFYEREKFVEVGPRMKFEVV